MKSCNRKISVWLKPEFIPDLCKTTTDRYTPLAAGKWTGHKPISDFDLRQLEAGIQFRRLGI